MKRVVTLINKLKTQADADATVSQLLTTVQMLQSELYHLKEQGGDDDSSKSTAVHVVANPMPEPVEKVEEEEKIVEVLEVDDEAVQAELEELRKNAELRRSLGAANRPQLLFDPIEDIPTLLHQTQVEEPTPEPPTKIPEVTTDLNDRLKIQRLELSDVLQEAAIKDLKKAITLNERISFINELFRGDESMYERSIKTINNFAIYAEAEYWIKRELKLKLGWDEKLPVVKEFDQLVRRRFL